MGVGKFRQLTEIFLALVLCCSVCLGWQSANSKTIGVRIIVVATQPEAQQVLDKLKGGAEFAALAKEKSLDPSSDDGGYIGQVDAESLRTELRDALRGITPGQFTGIVKVSTGFAILKVEPNSAAAGQSTSPPAQRAGQSNPYPQGMSPMPQAMSPTPQSMSPTGLLPLAGRASLRYPPDVSGALDFEVAFRNIPKPTGWNRDMQSVCDTRKRARGLAISHLEHMLDPGNPDGAIGFAPNDAVQAQYVLAELFAYLGQMDKAIAQWESAYSLVDAAVPARVPEFLEVLGTAYLHKSEMENDAFTDPGDRCFFPPIANTSYQKTDDSKKAIEYFLKYLDKKPDDVEVKWLLNLSYMTLGQYPSGVPPKYLVPASAFESKENIGRFIDVAPVAGLKLVSWAGGIIVDDFDNDGQLDIVTSSSDNCEPLHFFHNNGDGTFTDRTAEAGLSDQIGGLSLFQTDYNNDGCLDIYVPRGAWQFPSHRSLLRNNCDGTFTDVTREAGLAEPMTASQASVWVDLDNDGWLDLFIGNEQGPSVLFHNKGDGTFENISHSSGVDKVGVTKAVVTADYDNDGYMDLYASNLSGVNLLYHNNHNLTFTEVGKQAGVQEPYTSFAAWFFDYDNDGWPDLLVPAYPMSLEEGLRSYLGMPVNAETLKLYKNMGNGTFKDVTADVGLNRVFNTMGSNFGDIDNDGYLDIRLGNGTPPFGNLLPNVLFRNKEGKSFVDVTAATGTGDIHKGHGVAFADIDRDGDEDMATMMGGAVPADAHAFRLFENPGNGNDWINLKLAGVKSNRAAIGARIKVTVENEGHGTRPIYRTVGSGGSFGASPLEQHIGLGKSAKILEIEIWWPASNTRQAFTDVGKNQFLAIKEFDKNYTKLERKSFRLGGAARGAIATSQPAAKKPN